MPQKWKLSAGGASAQERADRLRLRSDKLARQATVWESGAEREPAVRRKLDDLPAGYTVLHDLVIDDENNRVDHLVIGQGGLYLVDGKRYSGRLVYSKKMLWHGRFPIVDKLETLVWEAENLSAVLGQEVVPVMCFVDAVLPQPVTTLGSVIVCRVSVLHTIVRSTHATMSSSEVSRILDIAGQLVMRRGGGDVTHDISRHPEMGGALDLDVDVDRDPGLDPAVGHDGLGLDDGWPASDVSDAGGQPTAAISTIPPIGGHGQFDRPQREPKARRWPRRVAFAVIAAVGVGVAAVVVWNVSRTSEKTAQEIAENPPTSISAEISTTQPPGTEEVTTTSALDLAAAGFSSSCPRPGEGWNLRPVWPGDMPGLAWYDFAFQDFDLSWKQFSVMTAPDESTYEPTAIPPANVRHIRIRPVFTSGQVGEAVYTDWTAPGVNC